MYEAWQSGAGRICLCDGPRALTHDTRMLLKLLDEVRQRLLLQQGQELYNEKRYDQAIAFLEKARSDYPKNQEIERLYIEVVYSQGVSMYEAGDLALA